MAKDDDPPEDPESAQDELEARRAANGKRLTTEVYEAVWRDYLAGERSVNALAKKYALSWQTVDRLIRQGMPARGWLSFEDRMRVATAEIARTAAEAHDETIKTIVNEVILGWKETRDKHLANVAVGVDSVGVMLHKARAAIDKATFTKTVMTKDGPVEVPLSIVEIARAVRDLASAEEILGRTDSFWRGGPTERPELMGSLELIPAGWKKLTPEQLAYIAQHNRLPDGVTLEMLENGEADLEPPPTN